VDHSSQYKTGLKNAWNSTATPPYISMSCIGKNLILLYYKILLFVYKIFDGRPADCVVNDTLIVDYVSMCLASNRNEYQEYFRVGGVNAAGA